ncbi:MAG: isoprenylcysteine carboxylmethyltransferase family protein [Spirochaetales bacterium]|nr:isoprenylcysteine carboxylmethyltransferase family protein [Spirochaetales bacterium]
MQEYLAALSIILLFSMVIFRTLWLRKKGIEAMKFGMLDKTDFLIPPFALFYFYLIFANAFDWPTIPYQEIFHVEWVSWAGVFFCLISPVLLLLSLIAFSKSFRIGIDQNNPDKLITDGIFAFSRNPIYVAFMCIFGGQFLVFPSWILLVYIPAAVWIIHRQVLREEDFLKQHYGREYLDYCSRVRRYV